MSIAVPEGVETAPFASGGLDVLLAAAGQDSPDTVLFRDDAGASSAGDVARRMLRLAALFAMSGLKPGERVLIVAGAQICALVALAAALRARLVPVLVGCGTGPVEIAAYAQASGAVALIGPSSYGALMLGDIYLSAAVLCESVRIVMTQGPEPIDGAVDVSFAALDSIDDEIHRPLTPQDSAPGDHLPNDPLPAGPLREAPMIGTFEGQTTAPRLVLHRQAVLLADALSLVEQARINPSKRMIVTIPPASFAGLVAGPFAALIGASCLVWQGPFDARRFLAACDAEPGYHLVVPAAAGPVFGEPALSDPIGSMILVSRFADSAAFALPGAVVCERPIVDLYAFGEETVLAQRRVDGTARPPARVSDKRLADGLGARLNRAFAETGVRDRP